MSPFKSDVVWVASGQERLSKVRLELMRNQDRGFPCRGDEYVFHGGGSSKPTGQKVPLNNWVSPKWALLAVPV